MRDLAWEACSNVRDLGGLRARDGRETRYGRVVRDRYGPVACMCVERA